MTEQSNHESDKAQIRLLALATALAHSNSYLEMYQLVGGHVRLHSGAELASICLIDPLNPTVFEAVSLSGPEGSITGGIRMPLANTLVGQAVAAGQPSFWTQKNCSLAEGRSLTAEGVNAAFITPIQWDGRSYGTFNIGYLGIPEPWDTIQKLLVPLAELLGCQLARLAELNELQTETKDRKNHAIKLERLHSLESLLTDASSLEEVIKVLAATLPTLLEAKYISFTKFAQDRAKPATYDIHGSQTFQLDPSLPVGEQIFRRQIETSEPLFIPGLAVLGQDSADGNQALNTAGVVSSIDLNILVHGVAIGTLSATSSEVNGFRTADQSLLSTVGSFMGRALQRIVTHNELLFVANHDHLTGLIRRRIFETELESTIQKASELHSPDKSDHPQDALCLIDIDHFKLINDVDGHLAGDKLIHSIATRIRRLVGEEDTASRLGADFVVLLRNRTPKHHKQLCEEITKSIATMPFSFNGRVFDTTVSIGLAFLTETTTSVAKAMSSAEAACHESKVLGGNRVSIESSGDTNQASRRGAASWTTRLQRAIDTDEFALYAQPIHPISSNGVRAMEVLVRLPNKDGSIIPPDKFIPIAEQYGLISGLDLWVTEHALRAMKLALDAEAKSIVENEHTAGQDNDSSQSSDSAKNGGAVHQAPDFLFINLSPNSISGKGFFEKLSLVVSASAVPTERIVFEITETGSMQNFETTMEFVNRMRNFGPGIALDDFGVGLSSLGYLRELSIDFLKIDGTLVCDVGSDPIKTAMIGAIKVMADALGVKTIAEHISNEQELSTLKNIGIDHVQGYFVGHPAPIERALRIAPTEPAYAALTSSPSGSQPDLQSQSPLSQIKQVKTKVAGDLDG